MASVTTTFQIENGTLRAMLTSPSGGVGQDIQRRGQRVVTRARALVPVRTGALRSSIHMTVSHEGGEVQAVITASAKHAMWVHEGTGIYAGRGMIRPKRSKFLAWQQGGQWIFARQVRGMPGTPYLRDALQAARG